MKFEKFPVANGSLYPERSSAGIEAQVEVLRKFDCGEMKGAELSQAEKEELLIFENELGIQLEEAYSISAPAEAFYLDYFLTAEGADQLGKILEVESVGHTREEIATILLANRSKLKQLPPVERKKLAGKAEAFSDSLLLQGLMDSYRENGKIIADPLHAPARVSVLISPELALKKIVQLRELKTKLKGRDTKEDDGCSEKLFLAKGEVVLLYLKRVNELIADQFEQAARVKEVANVLGVENLSEEEKALLDTFSGLASLEKNFSRFDKFLHGAGKELSPEGTYQQVSPELIGYAERLEKDYMDNALGKERLIREKGLDVKKVYAENVTVAEFCALADEVLDSYGLKSAHSEEEYDPDRTGPAPDDKWQFISRSEYKSMSVDGKQKVIKAGNGNKDIVTVIGTLLGHEIEGHVIQNENKSKIGLRLFQKVGAGRSQIFSEGGAMFNEDIITTEAFGFRNIPHSHYLKAMLRKIEGGNYLDCVAAFFESSQAATKRKKEAGIIEDEFFWRETENNLKTAINRCKRLFHSPLDWSKSSQILSRSKDTVYVEQLILLEKLRKAGLDKYAYVGGANLATLISLAKIGLLDPSKIKKPTFHALRIWERIKARYSLDESSSSVPEMV